MEEKLADTSIMEQAGPRPLEVRLLAVEALYRGRPTVLAGLFWMTYDHASSNGYTNLLISALAEQLPMYERLGFEPLGEPVRCGRATFIPMTVKLEALRRRRRAVLRRWERQFGSLRER